MNDTEFIKKVKNKLLEIFNNYLYDSIIQFDNTKESGTTLYVKNKLCAADLKIDKKEEGKPRAVELTFKTESPNCTEVVDASQVSK